MNIEHRTFNIEHRSSDGLSKAMVMNGANILEPGNLLRAIMEGEACRAATGAFPTSSIHHSPLTIS
jgi:hypothetical protein